MMDNLLKRNVRLYIYSVSAAVFFAAFIFGVINQEQLSALMLVASAICGLAIANVPSSDSFAPKDGE